MTRNQHYNLRTQMRVDTERFLESAMGGCNPQDPQSTACRNVSLFLTEFFRQMEEINRRARFRAALSKPAEAKSSFRQRNAG